MEPTASPQPDRFLTDSPEALHAESKQWISELEFMKDEAAFFQKLLDLNALSAETVESRKRLEQLQNRLIYYDGEVLDELAHDLREHETYLANLLQHRRGVDDKTYRDQHRSCADRVEGVERQMRTMKKDMFAFVEDCHHAQMTASKAQAAR